MTELTVEDHREQLSGNAVGLEHVQSSSLHQDSREQRSLNYL